MTWTPQFEQAIVFALKIHEGHCHKGTHIPYVSHLLGVTSIAMENGATETEAIGAMLHDTLERQVKLKEDIEGFLDTLTARFGEEVAEIVLACSDCRGWPKPKWKARKQFFLESIPAMTAGMVLVSLSDKIHNAQTAWYDYQREGNTIWEQYKGGHEGTVWYYRGLVSAFEARLNQPEWVKGVSGERLKALKAMLGELDRLVGHLEGTLPTSH